jgi:large subunit ribosomal protein L29
MKLKELKSLDKETLAHNLQNMRKELFNVRFLKAAKETVNPARSRYVRKTIARIKTLLNEISVRGSQNA